jgi:hypothetical protein
MGHSALRQVRTYLENTDAGVAVWLGVDGIDQQVMDQLPMLAREISRSLQTQGERLASITLNGRVVWRHDQVTAQQSSDFLLET